MELQEMRNLGAEISRKLTAVGVEDAEALRKMGSKEAFARMKMMFPNVCLVHLYTLEGAVTDVDYNRLSEETKADLKAFSDALK